MVDRPFGPEWAERASLAQRRDRQHEEAMARWEHVEGRAMRRGVAMGKVSATVRGSADEERRKADATVALGNALAVLQSPAGQGEHDSLPMSMVVSLFKVPGPGESWEVRVYADNAMGVVTSTLAHATSQPRLVLERAVANWRQRRPAKVRLEDAPKRRRDR